MSRHRPAPEQIAATDPAFSNWVAANAGAGKTHVLTQRVARLLLAGAPPQKILCLTYTKAAAAEMQTRLFDTLGGWAMEPSDQLATRLADIAGTSTPPSPQELAEARRLFARALETPGGLKIQTIHAFCTTLLRRFPLEAGISPRFDTADDRLFGDLQSDVRCDMAEAADTGVDDAFDRAARLLNEGGLDDLATAILAKRDALSGVDLEAALDAHFGDLAHATELDVARHALEQLDWETWAALRDVLRVHGGKADGDVAEVLPIAQEEREGDPTGAVSRLISKVLTQQSKQRSSKGFPKNAVKSAFPRAEVAFEDLSDWAVQTRQRLLGVAAVKRVRDLHAFAGGLLSRLEQAKSRKGLLDFDDLVSRTKALLTDQHMRSWVLYKLDQGIDHILVDEAQDTSPTQWAVIAAVAEEFLSGEGARPAGRSIFVVGDEKQSIYSFQGAEPRAFGAMQRYFEERLHALGTPLQKPALQTSYRSAPAVLEFVDTVFSGEERAVLTLDGGPVQHRAFREMDQGRVDLWPLVEPEDVEDSSEWWEPVDAPAPANPKARLAEMLARHIAELVGHARLPARAGKPGEVIRAGDIMVLLRTRTPFAPLLIQNLKALDVPVAGADRLSLKDELAVKDLLALIRVVILPSDDLSLAALLRSPLCGLSEDALFDLAHGRVGTLWQALDNAPEHAALAAFLNDMAGRADFDRPYEFLERALIHHDGRRKMLARLGPEAEDPIDELLVQALVFEGSETASLGGFLAWIETGDITVKREMDRGIDAVRVMTVHGAKGLEAPIVILPDTILAGAPGAGRQQLFGVPGGDNTPNLTLWAGRKADDDPVMTAARREADAQEQAEHARLLYVALTRAEDWLILCGANSKKAREDGWYQALTKGMDGLRERHALAELPSPTGQGTMLRFESGAGAEAPLPSDSAQLQQPLTLPDWLTPAPTETAVERASPSGLVAHRVQGGVGLGREVALRRGTAVHLLLERLYNAPMDAFRERAIDLLAAEFPDLATEIRLDAVTEAAKVLEMPEAGELFGPNSLAEVSVAIDPPRAGPRMIGRIDLLVPRHGDVLIVDIKTDAIPPINLDDVPEAYLAQLGAYAAGISPTWPEKPVKPAILWTATPTLMMIEATKAATAFNTVSFARTGYS